MVGVMGDTNAMEGNRPMERGVWFTGFQVIPHEAWRGWALSLC